MGNARLIERSQAPGRLVERRKAGISRGKLSRARPCKITFLSRGMEIITLRSLPAYMLAERTGSIEQQATKPGGILLLVERDMTVCRARQTSG